MSRTMHGDQAQAFRAVIEVTVPESGPFRLPHTTTTYAGPYATAGAARAAITREQIDQARRAHWRGDGNEPTVTGHVEASSITWTKLEDGK
jgi:hypothetical protein